MLFNSFAFLIFFLIVYGFYLVTLDHHRLQNRALLIASCVFYGWWDWRFLFLLFFTISVDYFIGKAIHQATDENKRKLFLTIIHVHGSNEYEDERDLEYMNAVNSGINKFILHSRLLVILKKAYDKKIAAGNTFEIQVENEQTASRNPANISRWMHKMDSNIAAMIKIAQKHKIPVILVGRAMRDFGSDTFETQRTTDINQVLKKYSLMDNVFYFDTQSVIDKNNPTQIDRLSFFEDSAHWTAYGHKFIASKIAQEISGLKEYGGTLNHR